MRFTKLGVLVLTLITVPAHSVASDIFESATVGFYVEKPTDWHFVTAEQVMDNLERTQLSSEEYRELLLKYANAPLVAMTKYEEPFDDLNPSLKVNVKPYGDLDRSDPKTILNLVIPSFERMFNDFEVLEGPSDTLVSGISSAYVRIAYSLPVPDGRVFPTTSELWIVPHGDYFFMVGSGTRTDEKTGTRKEIEAILDTVVIRQ